MKKDEKKVPKMIVPFIFIFIMLIALASMSYALFSFNYEDKKLNEMRTGTLDITFDENEGNQINVEDAYPMTLEEGMKTKPYTFKVKNTGSIDSNYIIKLIKDDDTIKKDGCANNLLNPKFIRYSISKNNTSLSSDLLSNVDSWILDTGTIKKGEENTYNLQLWLDYEASNDVIGEHFHALISVEATQSTK